jgi:hypothetical protein
MSWSHSKTGTPPDLIASLITPRGMNCVEPEQTIKRDALDLVQKVLMSYPQDVDVELACYGSQQSGANSELSKNTLSISIKPATPKV